MISKFENILIAHRGESYIAPENTLASINLAWELGAKAVEIDIQITLDNEIVVIHDENTARVGNLNKQINKTLLKDLQTVDIGLFKDKRWEGEQIPTLLQVLKTIPEDGKLIVEIKTGFEIINPLISVLNGINIPESQIEIISFNREVLAELKKIIPQYKMLWLLDLDYYLPAWLLLPNTKKTIRRILKSNLDGVNVWAGKQINKNYVRKFKDHNLLVYTWTVNDIITAKELIEMGVDAITTDRAAWLKKQLMTAKE